MGTLDRWMRESQEAQPDAPAEKPVPFYLKKTKPYGTGGTPKEISYLEPELKAMFDRIAANQSEIKKIEDEAKVILDEAKAAVRDLEQKSGKFTKTQEITEMVDTLGAGLDQFDKEAELVWRQADGLVVALQRKRQTTVTAPTFEAQLKFVQDCIAEVDANLSRSITLKLNHFKEKASTVKESAENLISIFDKPKSVKSLRTAGIWDKVRQFFGFVSSAAADLASALQGMRGVKSLLDAAASALNEDTDLPEEAAVEV